MELNKIKGNTYYINSPTNNYGVYVYKNKNCMLIDTPINNGFAKKVDELLCANNLHPKYIINTHNHLDHCGGNIYFKNNYPGCIVYSSSMEKLFMENPILYPTNLFSANPINDIVKNNKSIEVDYILDYGINKINDDKFEILSLKGHTMEEIGVITPEKVCFLGDSVFSSEILDKYSLPYLNNIDDGLKTLQYIKDIDADFFILGHGEGVFDKDSINLIVDKNIDNIKEYLNQIEEFLDQPNTREDLLENLIIINELPIDSINQYYIYLSSVSAFISYLYENKKITYSIEDGKVYYFKNPA